MASFALDISRFGAKTKARQDQVVRGICLRAYRGVVLKNPVDTGRSQNNWNVGVNNVDGSVTDTADTNAGNIIVKAQRKLKEAIAGDKIYLTNNVDYIEYLEDGSSEQAPAGMVAVTLREIPGIVEQSVAEAKR